MSDTQFHDRVLVELKNAGVTDHGLHKNAIKTLFTVIREGEHIHGAVAGRNVNKWMSLLVATDKRIIYIESDLLFHSYDAISYDAVSGIEVRPTPIFTSLTLFTKVHKYTLGWLQQAAATKFRQVVEDVLTHAGDIEQDSAAVVAVAPESTDTSTAADTSPVVVQPNDTQKTFLATTTSAVLATASRTGEVLATPVYLAHLGEKLYLLSREQSQKTHNMSDQKPLALTAFDPSSHRFVQIQGYAQQQKDDQLLRDVYAAVSAIVPLGAPLQSPLRDSSLGEYIVFEVEPTHITDNLV